MSDPLTTFVNICIHLPDFVYLYIFVLNSLIMFFVRKIQDMSHLHEFIGVTGPRKLLTFVAGPFLEIIGQPWLRVASKLSPVLTLMNVS